MYRFLFLFLLPFGFSCSDSTECIECAVVVSSDESIQCGISTQFDQVSVTELGEICDQAELDALQDEHDSTEFPIYSAQCGGEPYTRTTRLVCN